MPSSVYSRPSCGLSPVGEDDEGLFSQVPLPLVGKNERWDVI